MLVLYWTGGGTTGGGGGTTVNIGGGGAGLQLGVTAKDTITTSTTITADDLSGTGPAWVLCLERLCSTIESIIQVVLLRWRCWRELRFLYR